MLQYPCDTQSVIKNFLAADIAKSVRYKSHLPTSDFFSQICAQLEKIGADKLPEMVNDKERLERFIKRRWFL